MASDSAKGYREMVTIADRFARETSPCPLLETDALAQQRKDAVAHAVLFEKFA